MNLVCIRHPKYNGKSTPDLLCKTCCSIYVAEIKLGAAEIKEKQKAISSEPFKPTEWLLQKSLDYYKKLDERGE